MSRIKKGMRKTNRVELVKALLAGISFLPNSASISEWASIAEKCFLLNSMQVYCHKSNQITLPKHAIAFHESERYTDSDYHCDIQHDIAKLNKDTNDKNSLSNTDPMFPRPELSVFFNDKYGTDIKCIDFSQLQIVGEYCIKIKVDNSGRLLSSDGHLCKSAPEYVIEEFMVLNNIFHKKEGDINIETNKRITEYPFDKELNSKKRSLEADWELQSHAGGPRVLVEYFEGLGDKKYKEKTEIKRILARKWNIKLLEIWRPDLKDKILRELFKDFLK